MPRQPRQKSSTGIYHITFRGSNKSYIFQQDNAKVHLLEDIATAKEKSACLVFAYCIMDNHIHLLMKEGVEPIGSTIRRIKVRFTNWYNFTHQHINSIFGDRYHSEPIEDDTYLLAVIAYIFQNPIKAKLTDSPEKYVWSSYESLINNRSNDLLDITDLLEIVDKNAIITYTSSSPIDDIPDLD